MKSFSPCLPKYLYKYRKISTEDRESTEGFTRKLLVNNEYYFAKFSELNDPNEALFLYSEDSMSIQVPNNEVSYYPESKIVKNDSNNSILEVDGATAAKHVRNQLDKIHGTLCLTEKKDDLLMFDYYADAHKGICIEFSWEKFGVDYRATNRPQIPKKVQYIKKPLSISVNDTKNIEKLFYSKWRGYAHEKEWRLSYSPGQYKLNKAITGIIFGCATPAEDKELIKGWLKDRSEISFYEAKLEKKKYALKIVSI